MIDDKIILFDFDGVYKTQDFYHGLECLWIDANKLSGTNSYCDIYAQRTLSEKLSSIQCPKISFLGSGNYHYMSLFLTGKIKDDYCLVLFDNHSDMQKPVFDQLLSCGGWVRSALKTQKYLKQVALIGTSSHSFYNSDLFPSEKIIAYPYFKIENQDNWYIELSKKIKYPVYISIDKDVFPKDIAITNWDQGKLDKSDFLNGFYYISKNHIVLGMDVCGECPNTYNCTVNFSKANERNNKTNLKLLSLAEKVIA